MRSGRCFSCASKLWAFFTQLKYCRPVAALLKVDPRMAPWAHLTEESPEVVAFVFEFF